MSDNKVVPITSHSAEENRKAQGPMQTAIGIVSHVIDLSHLNAVAFGLKCGEGERLFWFSNDRKEQDGDYRKPLTGESVKVWFNDSAKNINVGGDVAQGIAEIQNISNDSEKAAFAWFAARRGESLDPK